MVHSRSRVLALLASVVLVASCGDEAVPPGSSPGSPTPGNPDPGNRPGVNTPGSPNPNPNPNPGANPNPGPGPNPSPVPPPPLGVSNPGTANPGSPMPVDKPGQTDFVTEEGPPGGIPGRESINPISAPGAPPAPPPAPGDPSAVRAPTGRTGMVEEGDVYKVDQNRLFYFNTYRGFVIYDLNDPKRPQRLGRLPVFGYPVEMFVAGNTVYALLRDALYLTQVGGNLQFERHNVSQLVAIDVSDLRNPKLLKTIDIAGQLREGVSRKIENTIYVVSYVPQSYYGGWRPDPDQQKEQATVYSFNVAEAQNPRQVGEFKVFEGGSLSISDAQGNSYDRRFESVAISATANALMVVENWNVSASSSGGPGPGPGRPGGGIVGCGSFNNNQFARVSLIDISNPEGQIRLHARFETPGNLDDQFKMTYVDDPATDTGTFYGIFARQVWQSTGCRGNSYTANTLESWDVSVAGEPRRLDSLDFGKRNEVVRASAYDAGRKVVYAITAQRIDPLYAISFANREDLQVASLIDGLSGEMSVFRLVSDNKFLLAVGQDNSNTCEGFQDTQGFRPTKIAVSLIDVQQLNSIRLVQRQCVAVKNAEWIGSDISNNLDQAHKMLGMHSDGQVNVISVPIHYAKRMDSPNDWWWYQWQTAVGLMTWDLGRYDPARPAVQQNVITNFGTFVHPHGEVKRSVLFTHQGATPERMMVNLSDTHISIANVQDLQNPTMQSEIELAPYYNQIYRFGDYLVEQVQAKPDFGGGSEGLATFRIKKAGGDLDDDAPLASFEVGQVYKVLKHDQSLVLFRQREQRDPRTGDFLPPTSEVLVIDMREPASPKMSGRVNLPAMVLPSYRFWCGTGAYWGGFWFEEAASFAMTERGFAFYLTEYRFDNNRESIINKLVFVDINDPAAPVVSQKTLPTTYEWGAFGVVADPMSPAGFFISTRKKVGEIKGADGVTYTRYKYFAQRWEPTASGWTAIYDVSTRGRLIRTWRNSAGERMFLSQDSNYRQVEEMGGKRWLNDYRLSLLREVSVNGKPAAELRDAHVLSDLYPAALLIEGDMLFVNARPQRNYYSGFAGPGGIVGPPIGLPPPPGVGVVRNALATKGWETESDRLMIFDVSANKLGVAYDQPTRMYNVQLMGTQKGRLFVNLAGAANFFGDGGDGILVIDVSNPRAPKGMHFLRTLGFATHVEFFDQDIYVASGHFGLSHLDLNAPSTLPLEQQTM